MVETSTGLIELDCIPHDEEHLTNDIYESEALVGENNLDNFYVIYLISQKLKKNRTDKF